MTLFPEKLPARLERGLDGVYLVAGPELLLVEEACDQIRAAARQAGIDERIVLEADARFDWQNLAQATENVSLFATRRLVELRLPSGKPGRDGGAALRDWLAGSSDDVLLIKAQAWDFKSEKSVWFRELDAAGVFVPCWAVKPGRLPEWISQRLATRGIRIERPACTYLAERLEGNLLAAAQEIERLVLLHGQGASLSLEQVRRDVADNARFDAFRLTELALTGQAGASARCIRGLREADTAMPLIVGALARELQVVSGFQALTRQLSESEAISRLGVWKSREQAVRAAGGRLRPALVERALAELSELDVLSKSRHRALFWLRLERLCVGLASNDESLAVA